MQKFVTCENCPLIDRPMIVGRGIKYGLMLVANYPGYYENSHQAYFLGRAADFLREALAVAEISLGTLWTTAQVLCYPRAGDTQSVEKARTFCAPRLVSEIKSCHPNAVVIFGDEFQDWKWSEDWNTLVLTLPDPKDVIKGLTKPEEYLQLISKLISPPHELQDLPDVTYFVPEDEGDFFEACADISHCIYVSIDTETTGLDDTTNDLLYLGIGTAEQVYIFPNNELLHEHIETLQYALKDIPIVGHNFNQFDRKFLAKIGLHLDANFDTLLAHYCLDERQRGHGLKTIAGRYFKVPDWSADVDVARLAEINPEQVYRYLAYDCYFTYHLKPILQHEMEYEEVVHIHDEILLPASKTLAQIESRGIMIDVEHLKARGEELYADIIRLSSILSTAAGYESFNPLSGPEVKTFLYDTLGIPSSDRRVDKLALDNLGHPMAKAITEYRLKHKLFSSFIIGLLESVDAQSRIHCHFLLFGTVTGRLSSRAPNLQNMPVVAGSVIRDGFVASPGYILVEADYNQLELRVAAHFSGDRKLIDVYLSGGDAHRQAASDMFQVPFAEVTDEQRYTAKHISFGILYGRGAKSLALSALHCSPAAAQSYINQYFNQYQGLWRWMRAMQRKALKNGFVNSGFGRRRRFPAILSEKRPDIERQAANAPIQSTASDICLTAVTRLESRFEGTKSQILLMVHDSILVECLPEDVDNVIAIMKEEMEENIPIETNVPMTIACKVGTRWGSMHDYQ